jgi:hypothetical protein
MVGEPIGHDVDRNEIDFWRCEVIFVARLSDRLIAPRRR